MVRIMNEINDGDHNVVGVVVEDPVGSVCRDDVVQVLQEMRIGRVDGPSDVSLDLITVSGGVGILVVVQLCLLWT